MSSCPLNDTAPESDAPPSIKSNPIPPPSIGKGAFEFHCGISIGHVNSVVCSSQSGSSCGVVELCVNDVSSRVTPSTIAFVDRQRLVGDRAADKISSYPRNTFACLPALLTSDLLDSEKISRFGPWLTCAEAYIDDERKFALEFPSEINSRTTWNVRPSQILSPFIRRLACFGVECQNQKRSTADWVSLAAGQFAIALPDSLLSSPDRQQQTLKCLTRACRTGALNAEHCLVLGQMTATIKAWLARNQDEIWNHTFPTNDDAPTPHDPQEMLVPFFHCGFSESSFALLSIATQPQHSNDQLPYRGRYVKILFHKILDNLGTADMIKEMALLLERRICENSSCEVIPVLPDIYNISQSGTLSRSARKQALLMMRLSEKAVKDLSGLPQCHVMFSNETTDIAIDITREEFEKSVCTIKSSLDEFLSECIQQSANYRQKFNGTSKLIGVEIVGGGSRIPWVYSSVETHICKVDEKIGVRRTLDATSVASIGATLSTTAECAKVGTVWAMGEMNDVWEPGMREEHMLCEKQFREIEQAELDRLAAKNDFDAELVRSRELVNATNNEALRTELRLASEWAEEREADITVLADAYRARAAELREKGELLCGDYLARVAQEKKSREEQLEAAMASEARADGDAEKEDHDTRKLSNKQRLDLAVKNKAEANDYLKGGLFSLAARHYLKALSHTHKIFDVTPEEEEQKKAIEVSCQLNLAHVLLKEPSPQTLTRAIDACSSVLEIDPENSKALYRRGLAYEHQQEWQNAFDDFKAAARITADPAVMKAVGRIDRQIKAQERKVKQMYGRMFA